MTTRGMPVTKQIKEEKRKRAQALAEEYSKLNLNQRLVRLDEQCVVHGGTAKKQRARLTNVPDPVK